jgi:hypothetical protein
MTLEWARADRRLSVQWLSPSSGLWVGTRDGEHAGIVERVDGAYRARDARGRDLGVFDNLESAWSVVEGGAIEVTGRSLLARIRPVRGVDAAT